LDVDVSAANLDRALRLMDALLKAFQGRGMKVALRPRKQPLDLPLHVLERQVRVPIKEFTKVTIGQSELPLRLIEDYRLVERPAPTKRAEFEVWTLQRAFTRAPRDRHFTGELAIELNFERHSEGRRWRDSKTRKLEGLLNEVVVGALLLADSERLDAIESEARRLRWEHEARQRQEDERRRRHEAELLKDLRARLATWTEARAIRDFAAAFESADSQRVGEPAAGLAAAEWLEWVLKQAEALECLALRRPAP
jgi:hypothetical protein